jgi:CheY-like chemotaxis protein
MRVLVVEDSGDMRAMIRTLLITAGHDPYLAHDIQSALAICRVIKPEFVLLDINLEGEDGYSLAETLRGECGLGDVQIWALSGQADNEERRRQAGIVGHILKPISFDHIRQLIGTEPATKRNMAIVIDSEHLAGIDPQYVVALKRQDNAVRRALASIGMYTSVHWTATVDLDGTILFRLIPYSEPETCIAQVTSLDLTLEPSLFEKLISEGARPCE